LMGNVVNNVPNVVEHTTLSPGIYKPLGNLGVRQRVTNILGKEINGQTVLSFTIPLAQSSKYHKNLSNGNTFHLLLAYSQEDDFQHHSIMRTSILVTL
jgi:hypothetical protein